jgi:uncharacterized RDD family membrane protein YckC
MSTPPVNPNPFAAPVAAIPPQASPVPGTVNPAATNPYAPPRAVVEDQTGGSEPLAERSDRLVASIVDVLIYVIAAAPMLLLKGVSGSIVSGLLFIGILVWNCILLANQGQTLGKKVKNIRIVRTDGSEAGFVRAALYRAVPVYLVSAVPFVGPLCGLVNVLFIFREDRRCVHDLVADTKVVVAHSGT